jgi:hypothetical protein
MRPPLARTTLALALGLELALHLFAIQHYGYFRDELYYLASTEHLAWGYVDHSPLSIVLLAGVRALLGDSLPALRLVPLLAGLATVGLTGALAWRLGGGRFAQGLAALAAVLVPEFLGTDQYYSMNALDLLAWTLAVWFLLGAIESGARRDWVVLGLVMGLGLLNKISMLWFCGGLGVALLLTPRRRLLLTPWPWISFAIALVCFAPNLVWQAGHHWPTLEFMHNATARKMREVSPIDFVLGQLMGMGPGTALVWIAGLVWGLLPAERSRGRLVAIVYLAVAALLVAGGRSRASYLAVAYPGLIALGGVALERWTSRTLRVPLRAALVTLLVGLGAVALPFALPLLPVERFVAYQHALGMTPHTNERHRMGPLPQQYADMHGWPEMVALVAKAYARLTPEERKHARVFGQNYGEAGAVDVLGRKLGLPRAMSGHNSYGLWGPGDWDGSVLIIIGGDRADNAEFFEDIEIVGQTYSPWAMPYENGLDVSIARKPRISLRANWAKVCFFI